MNKKRDTAGRVRVRDLSNSLYSPQDNEEVQIELKPFDAREVTIFTMFGRHHELDPSGYPLLYDVRYEDGQVDVAEESADAYAKMTHTSNRTKYYIKAGAGGHFYNPIGMYEGAGRSSNRTRLGRAEWNFVEVHKRCFQFYIDFLRTKNKAYLSNAEREVK